MNVTFEESAEFEHKFWLQILGDHARFILDSLAEKETEEIEKARYFKQKFDQLLSQVGVMDTSKLTLEAFEQATSIRNFKLHLLTRSLTGRISIHLSPTFLNHMVNEVDEYIQVLEYLKKNEVAPIFHELHYHLVWLLDAAGHAEAISTQLDAVEKRLKEKSERYVKHFEQFYIKAVELTGYLRTQLLTFPALTKMNQDVALEMELFSAFLYEIEELDLSDEVLGTFSALMADHMAREECYYLLKLAQSAGTYHPQCDPTKPRVEKN
ncbi:DUF2935 domain-containing protein [Ectobacillus polymachus]|uniref:DUF2935 domain-containing protein n=1 Tax=Ectobacillus polymachus TaxID=1508806 RepID=UPI003A87A765